MKFNETLGVLICDGALKPPRIRIRPAYIKNTWGRFDGVAGFEWEQVQSVLYAIFEGFESLQNGLYKI